MAPRRPDHESSGAELYRVPCMLRSGSGKLCGHKHCRKLQSMTRQPPLTTKHHDHHPSHTGPGFIQPDIQSAALRVRVTRGPAGNTLVDPFNALPISPTYHVFEATEYFLKHWAPRMRTLFIFEGHENPWFSVFWPLALQNALLFEQSVVVISLIALNTTRIESKRNHKAYEVHRGNVIANLRRKILTSPQACDDYMIWTSMSLTAADHQSGNLDAASFHYNGFKRMMAVRGSLAATTPWQRFFKMVVEAYLVYYAQLVGNEAFRRQSHNDSAEAAVGSVEILQHSDDKDRELFDERGNQTLLELPVGFSPFLLFKSLSTEMMEILIRIQPILKSFSEETDNVDLTANTHSTILRPVYIDLVRLKSKASTTLNRCACYGLLAFLEDLLQMDQGVLSQELLQEFVKVGPKTNYAVQECALWSYMMVVSILSIQKHLPAGGFVDWPCYPDEVINLHHWHDLEIILKKFYWTTNLLAKCKELWWTKVQEAHGQRPSGSASLVQQQDRHRSSDSAASS